MVDPVTGATPRNPWSDPQNLTEQSYIVQKDPELAAHLRANANGALTYSSLFKQLEAAQAREVLRSLVYTEAEHKTNPFFSADNLDGRSQFVKTHDPAVVEFWKREATEPVRLPWQGQRNLSGMSILTKKAPEIRSLIDEAIALEQAWAKDTLASIGADEAQLAQKRATTEKVLAGKK
jgi:hypothetical protein